MVVAAASVQDDEGAGLIFGSARGRFGRLGPAWADGICERVADWVAAHRPACPARPEAVERSGPWFQVVRRGRVVERTSAWLGGDRRLWEGHEGTDWSSGAFVEPAKVHLMARRVVEKLDR